MDDAAHLRRTIRRCTALLVATVGFTVWTLQPSEEASLSFLLATGAILYLVYEFFQAEFSQTVQGMLPVVVSRITWTQQRPQYRQVRAAHLRCEG